MVLSVILGINLGAQTRSDVIKAFNEGVQASKTDTKAAIPAFENVIVLAEKVGETCNDLKQKATQVLPGLYVKLASTAISEKKPAPEIIKAAKVASAMADKYGSTTSKENAGKLLVQGYY